jgi:hypothetical protein
MGMTTTLIGAAAAALAFTAPAFADPPADMMKITPEPEIKFVPSRVTSGISQAVLLGDPSVPGQVYIVRNKFPGEAGRVRRAPSQQDLLGPRQG